MKFFRQLGYVPTELPADQSQTVHQKLLMDKITELPNNQELEDILMDPDYDQSQLQDWFRKRYDDHWKVLWNRYLETGGVSLWLR